MIHARGAGMFSGVQLLRRRSSSAPRPSKATEAVPGSGTVRTSVTTPSRIQESPFARMKPAFFRAAS